MEEKIIFDQAKILVDRMAEYHKTAILQFKDAAEKKTITDVYNHIYSGVIPNLGCDSCVLLYLNQITVWMHREYPLYLKKLKEKQMKEETIDLSGKPKGKVEVDSIDDSNVITGTKPEDAKKIKPETKPAPAEKQNPSTPVPKTEIKK